MMTGCLCCKGIKLIMIDVQNEMIDIVLFIYLKIKLTMNMFHQVWKTDLLFYHLKPNKLNFVFLKYLKGLLF